jgi:alkylation response protein AidB-like acyl-CoA dehydrogenase
MGALGPGLLLEPYLAAAVVAPALIRRAASAAFQDEWLPKIASGDAIVVLAHADARGAPVIEVDGRLSGRKAVVAHGACADLLLVSGAERDGATGCSPSRRAPTASPCATTRRWTASARRRSC